MKVNRKTVLLANIVRNKSQKAIADALGIKQAKMSRVFSGELSDRDLETTDGCCDDYAVLDTIVLPERKAGDNYAFDFTVSNKAQALEIADSLLEAAASKSGIAKARDIRRATQLELSAIVEIEDDPDSLFRLLIDEVRARRIQDNWASLLDLVPAGSRELLAKGIEQNNAGLEMLIEKSRAGIQQIPKTSVALSSFKALFEKLIDDDINYGSDADKEAVYRTLVLLSGTNYIEMLVETDQKNGITDAMTMLVQYFGASKADNIARFVVSQAWNHNQSDLKDTLGMSKAA